VRGGWLLLEYVAPGESNHLGYVKSHGLQEILDFIPANSAVRTLEVRAAPSRLRLSDLPIFRLVRARIHAAMG